MDAEAPKYMNPSPPTLRWTIETNQLSLRSETVRFFPFCFSFGVVLVLTFVQHNISRRRHHIPSLTEGLFFSFFVLVLAFLALDVVFRWTASKAAPSAVDWATASRTVLRSTRTPARSAGRREMCLRTRAVTAEIGSRTVFLSLFRGRSKAIYLFLAALVLVGEWSYCYCCCRPDRLRVCGNLVVASAC